MPDVLALIALVLSVGVADSVNPATIVAALYLAGGERPRRRVSEFTAGVFAAYLLGGVAIVLGPGQLIISSVPKPGREARAIGEVVVGSVMLATAGVLWARRRRLAARELPRLDARGRSAALLGVTMTVVELPTAFPYLAATAAIVDSGIDTARQVLLLVLYNVCFVLPLLLIVAILGLAGGRALPLLRRTRVNLERHWPVTVAGLALLAGLFVSGLGVSALVSAS